MRFIVNIAISVFEVWTIIAFTFIIASEDKITGNSLNWIFKQVRMFIATLISVLLLSIYVFLGFLLGYLYGVPQSFGKILMSIEKSSSWIDIYSTSLVWLILAVIQSILSLIVATYIVYLLLIHSVLIYYGITTLEYSRAIRQGRLKYFFFYQSPRISPSS